MQDRNEILRKVKDTLDRAVNDARMKRNEEDRNFLAAFIGEDIARMLQPHLEAIADNTQFNRDAFKDVLVEALEKIASEAKLTREEMSKTLSALKIENIMPDIKLPEIRIPEYKIEIPEIKLPTINVPQPKVTVNVPEIKLPKFELPQQSVEFPTMMRVLLDSVDFDNPLPVILTDRTGKPYEALFSGGGGGKNPSDVIYGITSGGAKVPVQVSTGGAISITGTISATADSSITVTDDMAADELGAKMAFLVGFDGVNGNWDRVRMGNGASDGALRVAMATDIVSSVNIVSGSSSGTEYADGATASTPSGGVAMGDTGEESANIFALRTHTGVSDSSTLRVLFATDAVASVNIVSGSASGTEYTEGASDSTPTGAVAMGSTGDESGNIFALATHSGVVGSSVLRVVHVSDVAMSVSATNLDVRDLDFTTDDVSVYQVSGASWSVAATQVTSPWVVGATDLDIRDVNVTQDEILVHQVSGSNWSVSATQVTSPWVVGATDLDIRDLDFATDDVSIYQVSGHSWSTSATQAGTWAISTVSSAIAVGPTVADAADDGNAPVQVGGIARTANPTAVAGNDVVKATFDDLGRQLIRPIQVRDLTTTAYTTLTNGTETALLAGAASTFHDLIYVMGANESGTAVRVDLRCGTGGAVVASIEIPGGGTAGVALPVPLPMPEVAQAWTADMDDYTGTTVYISGLFSKEV